MLRLLKWAIPLLFVFSISAQAANCISVTFYDDSKSAPDDMIRVSSSWENINHIRTRKELPIFMVWVMYTQADGAQGKTIIDGYEAYGSTYVPRVVDTDREGVAISVYNLSPEEGKRWTFLESRSSDEDVTLLTNIFSGGLQILSMTGTDAGPLVNVDFSIDNYDRLWKRAYDLGPKLC